MAMINNFYTTLFTDHLCNEFDYIKKKISVFNPSTLSNDPVILGEETNVLNKLYIGYKRISL